MPSWSVHVCNFHLCRCSPLPSDGVYIPSVPPSPFLFPSLFSLSTDLTCICSHLHSRSIFRCTLHAAHCALLTARYLALSLLSLLSPLSLSPSLPSSLLFPSFPSSSRARLPLTTSHPDRRTSRPASAPLLLAVSGVDRLGTSRSDRPAPLRDPRSPCSRCTVLSWPPPWLRLWPSSSCPRSCLSTWRISVMSSSPSCPSQPFVSACLPGSVPPRAC